MFKLLKIIRFYDLYIFIENKLPRLLLSHHRYGIIITRLKQSFNIVSKKRHNEYRYLTRYFTIFERCFLPNLNKNLFKLLKIIRFYDLYIFIENKLPRLLLTQPSWIRYYNYDYALDLSQYRLQINVSRKCRNEYRVLRDISQSLRDVSYRI